MNRVRKLAFGVGGILVAMLFLGWLAFVSQRHTVEVAVKFMHQDTYPKAVLMVWVTNSGVRPILLGDAEVHFRSEGGSESLDWSHWDLPGDLRLQLAGIASFSLPAWEGEAQGRLILKYTYEVPLRKAISPVSGQERSCLVSNRWALQMALIMHGGGWQIMGCSTDASMPFMMGPGSAGRKCQVRNERIGYEASAADAEFRRPVLPDQGFVPADSFVRPTFDMQSTEQSKSVRCDSIIVAARGIAEVHGKRVVLFVPADEIRRVTLRFGRPEHRPLFSMSLGIILALVGVFGLIEFFRATRGYRYELGMMAFGVIGGSLIFDTFKERYFLEVEKKNGICRLVFSKNVKREEIGSFCDDARVFFNYQIQECA